MDTLTSSTDDFELNEPLKKRELEILALFAEKHTNQEIADDLVLSLNTVKWYARQIYGKLDVDNRRQAVQRANQIGLLGETEPESKTHPHNLPAQLTPFVGRHVELVELHRLLLDPGCRLLTITGPGGMGKTRLALQTASLIAEDSRAPFDDGVFLVPLADLQNEGSVASAVAEAADFRFYQVDRTLEQQLGQFLRLKRILLVLDNFEHLVGDETMRFLTGLLAAAPNVTMLVTSRVRLNLQGEQVFPLRGLNVLEKIPDGETDITKASGMRLFSEAAQRANPVFLLNSDNHSSVVAICRLVEGMPLAIELAAAWSALLEPAEILAEIQNGLDFLSSDAANLPARQRSLPAVLDASWQLLGEAERECVRYLSVFRGGFSGNAARQVADASPRTLLGLVGKSWVQREAQGRYRLLELLRQYGAGKLKEDETQEIAVRTRYCQYYCQWLSGPDANLRGREQQSKLNAIALDLENVHSAIFWAASHGRLTYLDQAIETLGLYYRWRGGYVAGDHIFARLANNLGDMNNETGQHALARIRIWRCNFSGLIGDREGSLRLAGEAMALLTSPILQQRETRDLHAHVELVMGYISLFISNITEAEAHLKRSYELYEQIGDEIGMAHALVGFGRIARNRYQFGEAEDALRRGIQLHERVGNKLGYGDALGVLGSLAFRKTQFDEAERLQKKSLSMTLPSDYGAVADGLFWLACTYYVSGRLAEAATTMEKCLSLRRDLGMQKSVIHTAMDGAMIFRDLGVYENARQLVDEALVVSRSLDYQLGIDRAKAVLGSIDLLEGNAQHAYDLLREGVAAQPGAQVRLGVWLGLAARALGRPKEAWKIILAELDWALQKQLYLMLITSLSMLALLLVDDGEAEQAVELYTLLTEHPYTVNSQWFSQIVTPEITAAAMKLSEAERVKAEERGRKQDLWQIAAGLAETKILS